MKMKRYKPLLPLTKAVVVQSPETGNALKEWTTGFAANCAAFRLLLSEIEKPRCSVKSIRKFTKVLKANTDYFDAYDQSRWTNAEREQMDRLLEAFRETRNRGVERLEHLVATR